MYFNKANIGRLCLLIPVEIQFRLGFFGCVQIKVAIFFFINMTDYVIVEREKGDNLTGSLLKIQHFQFLKPSLDP